jgi:hypothetical protein
MRESINPTGRTTSTQASQASTALCVMLPPVLHEAPTHRLRRL